MTDTIEPRPKDVLLIGDSMIKRVQVYGHVQRVWKFCYPGATAETMHNHIMTEKLPGEAQVGCVMINVGTNDLSRSRGRIRCSNEVFETIKFLILRMGALYPQARITFVGILPKLDCDNERVLKMNVDIKIFLRTLDARYDVFDYSHTFLRTVYPGRTKVVMREYFRDLKTDTVHLSDSGTQVQQDAFNRYFALIDQSLDRRTVDLKQIMWQSEWERFNYWNLKTPKVRHSSYMESRRITNFTSHQYDEITRNELQQKQRDMIGPVNESMIYHVPRYEY